MIQRIEPKTPVIMITSSVEKAIASLAEGARAYLLKAIDPKRLKKAVDQWFKEKA